MLFRSIGFVIVGFSVFLIVRPVNRLMSAREPPAPPTNRDCPFCATAIPVKATRCPHCTSDLGLSAAR